MKYTLVVPKKVQKEIEKVDQIYQEKIKLALVSLENDPFIGKKLEGEHKGLRSYRVWPYRIIYVIRNRELVVLILRVGHRQGFITNH